MFFFQFNYQRFILFKFHDLITNHNFIFLTISLKSVCFLQVLSKSQELKRMFIYLNINFQLVCLLFGILLENKESSVVK